MSETTVAIPVRQKIMNNTAVNVLAHMKSPRVNAQTRLRTDVKAQMAETLQDDMIVMLSGRRGCCKVKQCGRKEWTPAANAAFLIGRYGTAEGVPLSTTNAKRNAGILRCAQDDDKNKCSDLCLVRSVGKSRFLRCAAQ